MASDALSSPDASRAVLIGCHQYEHLDPLPAVAHNVQDLAELLRAPDVWGLASERITTLTAPTDDGEVLDAVDMAAGDATDTLLVYYAGHGLLDPMYGNDLYLALPKSSLRQNHVRSALPFENLRRAMISAQAAKKVLILDCCYGGAALQGYMGTKTPQPQVEVHGTYVITACSATALARAPLGARHTAFTGAFLEVLREGISGGPALLDMMSVYDMTVAPLTALSLPAPQQRTRNVGGRICIARNRAHSHTANPAHTNSPPASKSRQRPPRGKEISPSKTQPESDGPFTRFPAPTPPVPAAGSHDANGVTLYLDSLARQPQYQRPLPALLLLGPRGSGKTSLLHDLKQGCRERGVPVVVLAFGEPSANRHPSPARTALEALRDQLGPHLALRRTAVALAALDAAVTADSDETARQQMLLLFKQSSGPGRAPAVADGAWLARPRLLSLRPTRDRRVLGWFGRGEDDPLADLVTHNRAAFSDDPDERAKAESWLLSAFLADLREHRRTRQSKPLVLLIDDADASPAAQRFLTFLNYARMHAAFATGSKEGDGGLSIVAAAGRRLAGMPADCNDEVPTHARWWAEAADASPQPHHPWLVGRLSGWDQEQVWRQAAIQEARCGRPSGALATAPLVAAVCQATSGHPSAVDGLLHAVGNSCGGDKSMGLAYALRRTRVDATGTPGRLVDEAVAALLGKDFTHDEIQQLAHLSVLWGRGVQTTGDIEGWDVLYRKLDDRLWMQRVRSPRGKPYVVLHPWICLILQEWMSRDDFETAHQRAIHWIRTDVTLDQSGLLHHELALGRYGRVAEELVELLMTNQSAQEWLRILDNAVASVHVCIDFAVNQDPQSIYQHMTRASGEHPGMARSVWRLLAARILLANPLVDPEQSLAPLAADLYRQLAQHSQNDFWVFYDEANRYSRQ